ncbi:hypothetical protein [Thalassotalea ganghwensis]
MDKEAVVKVGGSVEKALAGDYRINVGDVLKEAWALTKEARVSINIGLLFCLVVSGSILYFAASYFGDFKALLEDPQANLAVNVIVTLLVSPFIVAIEMMGIFHAVGVKTHPKIIFAFLKQGALVAACALLSSLIISLGLNLLIVPGVYLLVALSLTLPLIVEKRLSPFNAIVVSIKATRYQWLALFSLYGVLFFALVVAFIPMIMLANSSLQLLGGILFFLALSHLAPMFYHVKGILYREIFGMTLAVKEGQNDAQDNIFNA